MVGVLRHIKLCQHLVPEHLQDRQLAAHLFQLAERELAAVGGGCPDGGRIGVHPAALRDRGGGEEDHQEQHAHDGEDLLVVVLQVLDHG